MYLCNHLHIVWQSRRKEFRPVIYTVEKAIQLDSAVHTLLLLCVCVACVRVCVCVRVQWFTRARVCDGLQFAGTNTSLKCTTFYIK